MNDYGWSLDKDHIAHSAHYSPHWGQTQQNDYNRNYYQQHKDEILKQRAAKKGQVYQPAQNGQTARTGKTTFTLKQPTVHGSAHATATVVQRLNQAGADAAKKVTETNAYQQATAPLRAVEQKKKDARNRVKRAVKRNSVVRSLDDYFSNLRPKKKVKKLKPKKSVSGSGQTVRTGKNTFTFSN